MPGPNPAQQTQAAQQAAQQQAESFLLTQKNKALQDWSSFFAQGSPASHWQGIQGPNFGYSPAGIGGGMVGPEGSLGGGFGAWSPTPPGGTPYQPFPPRDIDKGDKDKGGGGGKPPPGKPPIYFPKPPPIGGQGGGGHTPQ